MKISELYSSDKRPVSFEIFPPKNDLTQKVAFELASELAELAPDFISVTFSAGGGGNSGATIDITRMIQHDLTTPSMAHLTCVNMTRAKLEEQIQALKDNGIQNVLALRGDRSAQSQTGEYNYAKDLVARLAGEGFCVGAAAYPEAHIECANISQSIEHLKQKQDAGAAFFITQLFFDNQLFYRFWEQAQRAGITVPISCGIMPFMSKDQVQRMIFMCGASLPAPIIKLLYKYSDDHASLQRAGVEYASEQLLDLARHGAQGLHIYTMNKPDIARAHMAAIRAHCTDLGYATARR